MIPKTIMVMVQHIKSALHSRSNIPETYLFRVVQNFLEILFPENTGIRE